MSDMVQIMLIAECASETVEPLTAALDRLDISCVLITPPGWQAGSINTSNSSNEEPQDIDQVPMDQAECQALVRLVQDSSVAAIVANDATLAAAVGADGCHLDHTDVLEDTYRTSRNFLGPNAIVGAMPGPTRHMAMSLAEAGTAYVGYQVNNADGDTGLEYVAWWAEIFESPVVAFTNGDIAICKQIIEAGPPDFIAIPLVSDGGIDHLSGITRLITETGQLPIAAKDAK